MMMEFYLVHLDVFKEQNPKKKSYTYESKALKACSCLGFFLLPQHQINWVERIEAVVSNSLDHRAVKPKLNSPYRVRGPGLWKFNNFLLDNKGYVNFIGENYSFISENYSGQEDKRFKWELVKMEMRGLTIPYA